MFHSFHFTIKLVGYSVDPTLSEKHNFISIAISGGSNHNLTELVGSPIHNFSYEYLFSRFVSSEMFIIQRIVMNTNRKPTQTTITHYVCVCVCNLDKIARFKI